MVAADPTATGPAPSNAASAASSTLAAAAPVVIANPTAISPIKKTAASPKQAPNKKSPPPSKKLSSASSSSPATTTAASSSAHEKQLKLQKAEIAKRELEEMEAIERAFREDMEVWKGPNHVVFPRRYHSLMQLKNNHAGYAHNSVYYGSQSQGWMYGDGLARMGGLSWMDVTSPPTSSTPALSSKRKKGGASPSLAKQQASPSSSTTTTSGFLMDDVTIIEKSLHSAGLSRSNLTPRAYACLLEQARRYTLELLADAQDYAIHRCCCSSGSNSTDPTTTNHNNIMSTLLPSDLLLAAEMRGDVHGLSSTLPRMEDVILFAEEVNRVPLPSIPRDCYGGVILPPVEEQLTARTFDVVNGARVVQRMLRGGDYPMILGEVGGLAKKGSIGGGGGSGGSGSSNKKRVGGYGSTIGRQIAVNLKNISKREGGGGGDDDDDDNGGDEKSKGDGGATATPAPASSKASSSSGGGSKSQKRKLTEL